MAADVDDRGDFLVALDALFDQIQRSLHNKDPIGVQHCNMKLENYIGIVVAMSVALIEDNTTSNTTPRETDATSSLSEARVPQSRRTSFTNLHDINLWLESICHK